MKKHNFEPGETCFGSDIFRCSRCEAISIDKDKPYYTDTWKVVSEDCLVAFKQIELYDRERVKKND